MFFLHSWQQNVALHNCDCDEDEYDINEYFAIDEAEESDSDDEDCWIKRNKDMKLTCLLKALKTKHLETY